MHIVLDYKELDNLINRYKLWKIKQLSYSFTETMSGKCVFFFFAQFFAIREDNKHHYSSSQDMDTPFSYKRMNHPADIKKRSKFLLGQGSKSHISLGHSMHVSRKRAALASTKSILRQAINFCLLFTVIVCGSTQTWTWLISKGRGLQLTIAIWKKDNRFVLLDLINIMRVSISSTSCSHEAHNRQPYWIFCPDPLQTFDNISVISHALLTQPSQDMTGDPE